MKTVTIVALLGGALLIESAISNRNPLTTLRAIVQSPETARTTIAQSKGNGFRSTTKNSSGANFVSGNNAGGAPGNSSVGFTTGAPSDIVALGKKLQGMGYDVGEHMAFGGVAPVHVRNSKHYSGQAIDVNWPNTKDEPAKLDALESMLSGQTQFDWIWRAENHWNHMHIQVGSGKKITSPYGRGPGKPPPGFPAASRPGVWG